MDRRGRNAKQGPRGLPRYLIPGCAALFFAAYFAARFTGFPGAWAGSYVSTVLISLPSFAALWRYMGPRRASLSFLVLAIFGFVIETTGTVTGFPYGAFSYGESLGPKLAGEVPYILPVSYLPLVIGAVSACSPGPRSAPGQIRNAAWVVLATLLLALLDGVLDPGAAALGFWVWPDGGAYYGVPLSNYAGWLLSGFAACTLLVALGRWRGPPPGRLLDSALLALAFWCGVAVFEALWVPALLGVALYAGLFARRLVMDRARRPREL